MPAGPALLKRKAAADYLAISPNTLVHLVETDQIKTAKIKGVPKYPRTELDKYIRKLMKEG